MDPKRSETVQRRPDDHAKQKQAMTMTTGSSSPHIRARIPYSETAPKQVSMMMPVIWYGSALEAGRRSSK